MRQYPIICLGMTVLAILGAGTAPGGDGPSRARDPSPQEVVVFASRHDGYHTYRIPAIITGAKGTLLAFCEGRKNSASDSGDIDVVLRRSTDGGATWGPLQVIADAGPDTIGNPCPVLERTTGRIWLPLTRNVGTNTNEQNHLGTGIGTREVFLCHSDDDGATWSQPVNITAAVKRPEWTWYATGPGCGIQLRDGLLVIPCDHQERGARNTRSHVIDSDDHGATWHIGGSCEEMTNESQVVELDDGELLLNMRSHHGRNRRAVATSRDRGATWSAVRFDDTLTGPPCQGSMIRIPGEAGGASRLLFSNPAGPKRERLTVRLSDDQWRTWRASQVVYEGPAAYSSLVALPGGQVGCLYEKDGYKAIVFARFGLVWLTGR